MSRILSSNRFFFESSKNPRLWSFSTRKWKALILILIPLNLVTIACIIFGFLFTSPSKEHWYDIFTLTGTLMIIISIFWINCFPCALVYTFKPKLRKDEELILGISPIISYIGTIMCTVLYIIVISKMWMPSLTLIENADLQIKWGVPILLPILMVPTVISVWYTNIFLTTFTIIEIDLNKNQFRIFGRTVKKQRFDFIISLNAQCKLLIMKYKPETFIDKIERIALFLETEGSLIRLYSTPDANFLNQFQAEKTKLTNWSAIIYSDEIPPDICNISSTKINQKFLS